MKGPDFISLIDAVNIIAECVQPTPFPFGLVPPSSPAHSYWNAKRSEIDEERKFSTAALLLSKALENNPAHWWLDDGRHPKKSDDCAKDGREILNRAIDCHRIRQQERQSHLFECLKDGANPLEKPIMFSVAPQLWQPGDPVGFDRSELIAILNHNSIAHPFGSTEEAQQNKENSGAADDGGEYTLDGKPAIAGHLGMSESWVKQHLKKGLPHKKKENRRVTACPAEIDKWFKRLSKK